MSIREKVYRFGDTLDFLKIVGHPLYHFGYKNTRRLERFLIRWHECI